MSRKNVIAPFKVFDAINMASDKTSTKITDTKFQDNIGFQMVWSGASGSGQLLVEVSNDDSASPTNWTALDFGSSIVTSGASGSHVININQCPYAKMRLRYIANGATGSLTVTIVGREV